MKRVKLFTAVYHRFAKTKISLDSIIESIEQSENDAQLMVGINGSENEEMTEWLKDLATHDKVKIFFAKKNIGKAHIINEMHKAEGSDIDYFISVDSDMVARENNKYNWIDEFVKLMEHPAAQNFGLFSSWQDGMNAHNLSIMKERTEFLGHFIKYGGYNGTAGGCVIMRNSDFLKIGRYHVYDVYNGDDAIMMNKTYHQLKKLVGVTEDIKLEHLENTTEEKDYQEWKVNKCYGKLPCGPGTKGFWD
jgi:hypothetical protein